MTTIERAKAYIAPDGTIYDAPTFEAEVFRVNDETFPTFDKAFNYAVDVWCASHVSDLDLFRVGRKDLIALAHFILSLQSDEAK
jgi:hypothetical protein